MGDIFTKSQNTHRDVSHHPLLKLRNITPVASDTLEEGDGENSDRDGNPSINTPHLTFLDRRS